MIKLKFIDKVQNYVTEFELRIYIAINVYHLNGNKIQQDL